MIAREKREPEAHPGISLGILDRLSGSRSRLATLLPVGLLLVGFYALWSWNLGAPALSGDEAFVASLAARPAPAILARLNGDEPHPPVYYLAMHAWHALAGTRPEFLVRYPSLLAGLLLLTLTYRLGRDLGLGHRGALAAMVVLGLNPQVTVHLREARMYGPMIVSLALVALVALRFKRLPRRSVIWLAATASVLALLTHYFNSLFVAALGLWGLIALRGAARRRWILSQALAWVLFGLWLPLMGRGFFNPTSLGTGKTWSFVLPPWEALRGLTTVAVFGYRDVPALGLALAGATLLVAGWFLGLRSARGQRRWFLLVSVAAPLAAFVLLGWFKPLFHPKYVLPWLLFVALGLASLTVSRPRLGLGVWLALVLLMAFPAWHTVRKPYDPSPSTSPGSWLGSDHRDLSAALAHLMGSRDVFGLGTPDVAHCYYANSYFDRSLGCALIPAHPEQPAAELERQVAGLLAEHTVLWYLAYYNPGWDPQHLADTVLARRALSLGEEEIAGQTMRLYTAPETVLRDRRPVGARFGEVAELEGLWLTRGRALHLVLIWRALADHPPVPAKVFVHLVDNDGRVVVQDDSVPVAWTRPLDTWRLDEQLLDVHTLALPDDAPLGEWSLRVGLYNPEDGARLPAYLAETHLADDAVAFPLSP